MMNILCAHPELFIGSDICLREALRQLNDSGRKTLFLLDGTKLQGVLTDGDIRRWMLNGGTLDSPVTAAANFHPKFLFDTERGLAESRLTEYRIDAIPIVDENLNMLDVITRYSDVDPDAVRIRELGSADMPLLFEFFDQMAGDTRAMFNRNDINRIRAAEFFGGRGAVDQKHFAATVETANGEQIVGYVFLWDLKTRLPWLGIAVRESWKGRHLGRKLLDHAGAYAEAQGCGGVMLTSVPANIRAHSLYARMGYDYCGTYLDGEFLFIRRFAR